MSGLGRVCRTGLGADIAFVVLSFQQACAGPLPFAGWDLAEREVML
jgi:hypothetical protein